MQWSKYSDLIGSDPMLARMLDEHVGPPMVRLTGGRGAERTLPEWVQQKLKYISVRPWDSLNLSASDARKDMAAVRYTIYFHIENGDPHQCFRARSLTSEHDSQSLKGVMKGLEDWHKLYWAKQDNCPLVFDAILCRGELWRKVTRYTDELVEQTINIWRTPEGFRP